MLTVRQPSRHKAFRVPESGNSRAGAIGESAPRLQELKPVQHSERSRAIVGLRLKMLNCARQNEAPAGQQDRDLLQTLQRLGFPWEPRLCQESGSHSLDNNPPLLHPPLPAKMQADVTSKRSRSRDVCGPGSFRCTGPQVLRCHLLLPGFSQHMRSRLAQHWFTVVTVIMSAILLKGLDRERACSSRCSPAATCDSST